VACTVWANGQEPFDGLTMVGALNATSTALLDMDGRVVSSWQGASQPASFAYVLPDGSILRPCRDSGGSFQGGGVGGRLQGFDANGTELWDYLVSTEDYQQHHDIQPMPNGNVLVIAWERKSRQEAIDAGRQSISGEMWPTLILEVEPVGATGGNIVWQWHLWDHLVQDADPGKPGYGVVADHPELIDINYGNPGGPQGGGDWIHANSIDYNEQLDQIVFSSRAFNEIYVIDHSTTTAEAAGHTGGNRGMGGDILYRWGNPQVYGRGSAGDQHFYVVHGVNWIDCGLPGAGNLLAFNNGDRAGLVNDYSTVDEIAPPLNPDGTYTIDPGAAFGPDAPVWTYGGPGWYAQQTQCGAYRLPNGNTLITEAQSGYVFEVTAAGTTVWEYDHPSNVPRALRYWVTDLDDYAGFADCLSGPDGGSAGCEAYESDCDDDIDLEDFAGFQSGFGKFAGP
jgi:hypothetical protein